MIQLECHLQCQTHFVNLWIFHQFLIETYHLWVLFQMAVSCICTCQIGMWILWVLWSLIQLKVVIARGHIYKRDKFILFSFGKILLSLGSLLTGLINAGFSLARSKHSLTLPLGLGMRTKLLQHSDIPPMPRGVMMSCCWSLSNSCLKSFVVHMLGSWGHLVQFTVWLYL